jgi:DNA-binding transcriptional LysR family regulator
MEIIYLESFCAVAKYKSFQKATEILQITQSGITRRIQKLEEELEVKLFNRTPQSVLLTKQGQEFLLYAERLLNIYSEGKRKIHPNNFEEILSIAGPPTICSYFIPYALQEFNKHHQTRTKLFTNPSEQVIDLLLDHTIDIGLTSAEFPNPLIHFEKVFEEEIICVAHPVLAEQYFDGEHIINEPIPVITCLIPRAPWNDFQDFFKKDSSFKVVIEAHHIPIVDRLARIGLGITMLPISRVLGSISSDNLVKVTIPNLALPKRDVFMITLKNQVMKPSVLAFKEIVKNLPASLNSIPFINQA